MTFLRLIMYTMAVIFLLPNLQASRATIGINSKSTSCSDKKFPTGSYQKSCYCLFEEKKKKLSLSIICPKSTNEITRKSVSWKCPDNDPLKCKEALSKKCPEIYNCDGKATCGPCPVPPVYRHPGIS